LLRRPRAEEIDLVPPQHLVEAAQLSEPQDAGTELWRLLGKIYQHKWLLLGSVLLAAAVAYFWTQRLQRIYQADCTIEYDPNPMRPLGHDMDDSSMASFYWASREFFMTQNKILTSRALAERVVRKLSLHQNRKFMGVRPDDKQWRGGDVINAAQALQGRISVEQERDTRIVHIRVNDSDRERAMVLANALAESYIEKTLQDRLGSTSSALEWLGQQLDTLKQQLERSELSLHEFVEDKANLSMPFDEQQKLVSSDIHRYSERLTEARVQHIEIDARVKALEEAREAASTFERPALTDSPALSGLRERYFELAASRYALSVKYGDQHPQIKALDAQMERLHEHLRGEIDSVLANARAQLKEVATVESGVLGALQQSNHAGLELNLQEITYRRLQRERDNAARLYGSILERTADTDLTHALQVSFVRIVDRALRPNKSIYPDYRRNLTIGSLLGLLLGMSLAFLLTQLDRGIRTIEDAEALGVTILGIMPRIEDGLPLYGVGYRRRRKRNAPEVVSNRDLVVHSHPKSSVAECCRTIRTNLTFMAADRPQRAVAVTSANPREGKTTVTISLAISLAQGGKRVLLVDTDLRKPRIHRALSCANSRGVTTVLVGEHSAKEAIQSTEIPGLDLMSSGPIPPNPAELLHTPRFRELVVELLRSYDHVRRSLRSPTPP
jgi:uncharacterized protein involved in exopolysaccharide biosynthesis